MEGMVSAFQNGMTLAYLLKNGRTIVQNLRSCVFGQNFDKTSGGYLGHLKPVFGATKGMDGCTGAKAIGTAWTIAPSEEEESIWGGKTLTKGNCTLFNKLTIVKLSMTMRVFIMHVFM